jgi:ethanolamine utilization protein EutA
MMHAAYGTNADAARSATEAQWRAQGLGLHEDIFEHLHLDETARAENAATIEAQERLVLRTVGIDIGSSTSHLLFGRIVLEREPGAHSARYVVVAREIVHRSPIMLTPFTPEGLIDGARLGAFIAGAYAEAGIARSEIDCGAVILTGEAIKKANAAAIDELFAAEAGTFVCATAGHHLEATLAAYGSGAVRLSRERDTCVLHVDVGGGTTKLALIDRGTILGVSAFAVGGRLLAVDADGAWSRIDESAQLAARELGVAAEPASMADPAVRAAIVGRLADVAIDMITDAPLDLLGTRLQLTDRLARTVEPTLVTMSGGVSEYLFGRERADFGDIARPLADELRARFARVLGVPIVDPGAGIRATVLGASQFTVQVSGKTIFVSHARVLPLRNVPVVRMRVPDRLDEAALAGELHAGLARLGLPPDALLAIALQWDRDPEYRDLRTLGTAIMRVVAPRRSRPAPLVLMIDGDVGKSLGHLMHEELHLASPLISVDGVDLNELDYVDLGEPVIPPGVVPLVIKSLVFS